MNKSSHNGNQARQMLRDLERLARDQREIQNSRFKIQERIDRAVALADREIGVRGPSAVALADRETGVGDQVPGAGAKLEPPPFSATGQPTISPAPLYRGVSAPVPPLPHGRGSVPDSRFPVPDSRPPVPDSRFPVPSSADEISAKIQAGWTYVYGASGNPITSGFLVDLGEYNPQMMGLNAVRIYEQMRRGDGQVYGILQAMMLPVKAARWELVPGSSELRVMSYRTPPDSAGNSELITRNSSKVSSTGEGVTTSAKANEVCEFVRANLFGGLETRHPSADGQGGWATQSFTDVLNIALRMLVFGCAVYEMIFTVDGDKLRLRRCADRQALTFYRWHTDPAILDPTLPLGLYDDGETLIALQQYGYRGGTFVTPLLPADKIARFTCNQEGANFWGLPPTRAMYPHWYVKSALQRIDAIACERNSLGVPSIQLPSGASREDIAAAQNFVTQLAAHERTGITLPSGTEFKIVGVEGRLRDILPSLEYQDMQMARAGLAMFMQLGESARSGSRALGQEQTDFFMLALQVTADQIASVIRHDTIRPLVEMNFGAGAPVPVLKAANVQARTLEDTVEAIARLAQAGAWTSDRESLNRLRHELGFGDLADAESSGQKAEGRTNEGSEL